MRFWARISRTLICICLPLLTTVGVVHAGSWSFHARVVYVVDGDTVEIMWKNEYIRVRIWGIDTPEWDQPYSTESKAFTKKMLAGKIVDVFPKDHDKYGRLVAVIKRNHVNISEELVRSGLAWVHIYYCKEPICNYWKKLQRKARSEHLGLWHDRHPTSPWQWKWTHKR